MLYPDAAVACGAFWETPVEGIRLTPTSCPVRRKPSTILAPHMFTSIGPDCLVDRMIVCPGGNATL